MDNKIKIAANFNPDIVTMSEASFRSGRSVQYLNKLISQGKLNYGYVLDEKKVLVDDRKYRDFIRTCMARDRKKGR